MHQNDPKKFEAKVLDAWVVDFLSNDGSCCFLNCLGSSLSHIVRMTSRNYMQYYPNHGVCTYIILYAFECDATLDTKKINRSINFMGLLYPLITFIIPFWLRTTKPDGPIKLKRCTSRELCSRKRVLTMDLGRIDIWKTAL